MGQKPGPFDKNMDQKLRRSFNKNPGISDRVRARKYRTSATTVRKTPLIASLRLYRALNNQIEMISKIQLLSSHQENFMMMC